MKTATRLYRFAALGVFLSAFLVIVIACIVYPRAAAQAPPKDRQVVLKGARLIYGTGQPPIENSVLVINGKQIVAAGKSGAVSIPKDAVVQDVSGKKIMPAKVKNVGRLGVLNHR